MYISYIYNTQINVLYLYISYRNTSQCFFRNQGSAKQKRSHLILRFWSLSELAVLCDLSRKLHTKLTFWHLKIADFTPPPNQLPSRACVETCPDPLLHPKRRLRPKGYLKDNPKTADLVSRSLNLNPRMPGICHGRKQFLEVGLPLQPLIDLNWDRVPRLLMGQNCWDG